MSLLVLTLSVSLLLVQKLRRVVDVGRKELIMTMTMTIYGGTEEELTEDSMVFHNISKSIENHHNPTSEKTTVGTVLERDSCFGYHVS
jgi:hypothetical protein